MQTGYFTLGDDVIYEGFTDGSSWNGFVNVWLTREVAESLIRNLKAQEEKCGQELGEEWTTLGTPIATEHGMLYGFGWGLCWEHA